MLTPYHSEILENIIRNAKHGLAEAQENGETFIDYFQHILDEANRLRLINTQTTSEAV